MPSTSKRDATSRDMSDLSEFTTKALLAELERRRWENDNTDVENWCHDCQHFKVWAGRKDPPDNYNPCGLKHKTAFACPPHDYTGDRTGFYRLFCEDFRKEVPRVEPPKFVIPLHALPPP